MSKNTIRKPYPDGYGTVLHNIVLMKKPSVIVEFGTSWGYTAVSMASAMKKNGGGKLYSYDNLLECINVSKKNIQQEKLSDIVTIEYMSAFQWFENPFEFDLLYIDIHNDADKLNTIINHSFVQEQIAKGASILFEGGSQKRDEVCRQRNVNPISNIDSDYSVLFGKNLRHSLSILLKKV